MTRALRAPGVLLRAPGVLLRAPGVLLRAVLACGLVMALSACATPEDPDPLEYGNRSNFSFNEGLDRFALRPVSRGWAFVTFQGMRRSVDRFFLNLEFPGRFLSNLLQAEARGAGTELTRFVVNTTVGLAGFFDPAGHWGLRSTGEDFGQAFGRWGMGPGAYLVIPALGPSGYRDGAGLLLDTASDPATYVPGANLLKRINQRALADAQLERLRASSLDFYVFTRDAFRQRREALVRNKDPDAPHEQEDDLYDLYDDEALPES